MLFRKGKKVKKEKEHDGKIAVLITTDSSKRGVFAGFINPDDMDKETIIVEELRMAVYWSSEMHGVLGLASMGPDNKCKISKSVKRALIKGVTAVIELSEEALKNWRKEHWA